MTFRIPSTKAIDFENTKVYNYGRNEKVKIRNPDSGKVKELKWKRAEPLVESGQWEIVNK